MTRSGSQRGMSMIELLTVMTVLGIVIVVVAPGIGEQLRNAQIRNAADAMMAGLQIARTEAIRRNERVRFSMVSDLTGDCVLSSTAGSWVVSIDSPVGNCDTPATETTAPRILAVHSAADGNAQAQVAATQSDNATAASAVTFNAFGRPIDGAQIARLMFNSASNPTEYRTYRVDISAIGGVRMCDTQVSTTSDDPRRCSP